MKRIAGIFAALILVPACGVGDPNEDMQPNPTGRVCGAVLSTTGSFAPDTAHPPPADSEGCWPYGTWTFTAKVEMNDCSAAPAPLQQYQIKVEYSLNEDGDPVQTYKYMTEPTAQHTVKVTQGGAGLCEGELSIYSAAGKNVWLLKPALFADNTIAGDGEYGEFTDNQWPFEGQ